MLPGLHTLLGILEVQVVRDTNHDQLDLCIAGDFLQSLDNPDVFPTSVLGGRLGVRLAALFVGGQVGGTFEDGMEGEEVGVGGDDRVVERAEREAGAEDGSADGLGGHYGVDTVDVLVYCRQEGIPLTGEVESDQPHSSPLPAYLIQKEAHLLARPHQRMAAWTNQPDLFH
jgi:hypothetical protein